MIIAKSILLRSPALQRAMCAMGFHWWRKVSRWYSIGYEDATWNFGYSRLRGTFTQNGITLTPLCFRRCRFCGKEE